MSHGAGGTQAWMMGFVGLVVSKIAFDQRARLLGRWPSARAAQGRGGRPVRWRRRRRQARRR
eukprot:5692650-Alexandrium_andersonii.AAC.1